MMNKKIHPAVTTIALVTVVLILIYYGWRTAIEKPMYPGFNAPQPTRPRGDGDEGNGQEDGPKEKPTNAAEARKLGIPGAVPLQKR